MGKPGKYVDGVKVPGNYKDESDRNSREWKIAAIKAFVLAHPNEKIRQSDFNVVIEGTTANSLIPQLIKQGRLHRHKITGPGVGIKYAYTWTDATPDKPIVGTGQTTITVMNLPELPFTDKELDKVKEMFLAWTLDDTNDASINDELRIGDAIFGAQHFVKYIVNKCDKIKQERKQLLEKDQ